MEYEKNMDLNAFLLSLEMLINATRKAEYEMGPPDKEAEKAIKSIFQDVFDQYMGGKTNEQND